MKFLIIGLGNIGDEYLQTRHNVGFEVADELCQKNKAIFKDDRYAFHAEFNLRGKKVHVIKPTTFMNLSGKAMRYWMQKLDISIDNTLVLVDDLAIEFGTLRLRGKGSDAGHNGLKNINELVGTQNYSRLRFGIGNNFSKGKQINFVLSKWNLEEEKNVSDLVSKAALAAESFVLRGLALTMTEFNK